MGLMMHLWLGLLCTSKRVAHTVLHLRRMQAAINQLALDNTDQRACFDSHMAKAEHDADGMKVRAWGTKMPECLYLY